MAKEIDDKRLVSTITIIILLVPLCIMCWFDLLMSVRIGDAIANYVPPELSDESEARVVLEAWLGEVSMGFGVLIVYIISGLIILISSICLGFSIRNSRFDNKPVKVINIILSCVNACALVIGITALILKRVF